MNQQVQTFDWDDMNCFRLDVSMWSGRSKLTRDDLKDPDAVPPDALASLGSLKLIDPDQLKIFNALKRRAIRACEAHGVTFLGGYVIAEHRVADLDKKLVDIKQEYEQSVTNLVTKFNEQCEDWLNQNSQWAHIIMPRLPSPSDIAVKFKFDWTVFKVKPLATSSGHGSDSLANAKDNLVDSSVDEVCRMLGESARNLLKTDRTEYTSQAFNSVDKAIGKCDELSFINPNLGVLSSFLKDIKLSVMSKAISPDVFRTIFAAVASPDSIRKVIELHKAQVPMDNMTWALSPMQPTLTVTPNKTDDEGPVIASVFDTVEPVPTPEYVVPTLDELDDMTSGNPVKIECEPVSCEVVKTLDLTPKEVTTVPSIDEDADRIIEEATEFQNRIDGVSGEPWQRSQQNLDYIQAVQSEFASRGANLSNVSVSILGSDQMLVEYCGEKLYVEMDVMRRYPSNTVTGTVDQLIKANDRKLAEIANAAKKPVQSDEGTGLMNLEGII